MENLKIIPLGGLGEFGLNMMLIEYGESAIAIDCGVMFPGADLLGIDLVIPDVSYLLEHRDKLKAIVLTHAHEDHVGALPYILKHLDVPIFGSRLTLGLLANKLREHDLEDTADIHEITAGAPFEIAPFRIEGIRVTHSLMDCLALAIETPMGVIIHTGDFKIDNTPMEGEMFDLEIAGVKREFCSSCRIQPMSNGRGTRRPSARSAPISNESSRAATAKF